MFRIYDENSEIDECIFNAFLKEINFQILQKKIPSLFPLSLALQFDKTRKLNKFASMPKGYSTLDVSYFVF